MKCQNLFSSKNNKKNSICHPLEILSSVLSINPSLAEHDMSVLLNCVDSDQMASEEAN